MSKSNYLETARAEVIALESYQSIIDYVYEEHISTVALLVNPLPDIKTRRTMALANKFNRRFEKAKSRFIASLTALMSEADEEPEAETHLNKEELPF